VDVVTQDGETLIILFGGGTKHGQQSDIERAKTLHIEYKARKKSRSATNMTEKQKR